MVQTASRKPPFVNAVVTALHPLFEQAAKDIEHIVGPDYPNRSLYALEGVLHALLIDATFAVGELKRA